MTNFIVILLCVAIGIVTGVALTLLYARAVDKAVTQERKRTDAYREKLIISNNERARMEGRLREDKAYSDGYQAGLNDPKRAVMQLANTLTDGTGGTVTAKFARGKSAQRNGGEELGK